MTLFGNDIKGKNIVVIGWPTSGKTFFTNFLASSAIEHVIIHTDDYYDRIKDFKQELYVLLDDLKKIDHPVIVEGILGYRLLRKGVEWNCFYPHIVVEFTTTLEEMEKIYLRERKPHNYPKAKGLARACEYVLQDYKEMANSSPPVWIQIPYKSWNIKE